MTRRLRRLRNLVLGCPVCGRHTDHLTFCRMGWDWKNR
jgi:hypothetical protein